MLKLGLGLHLKGDPARRLKRALDNLARMTSAHSWRASVLELDGRRKPRVLMSLHGSSRLKGPNGRATGESAWSPDSQLDQLLAAPAPTSGRVRAIIFAEQPARRGREISSILQADGEGQQRRRLTWISLNRAPDTDGFCERERRLVELFHSQTAWAMWRLVDQA
jgi:hypothetical protein